MPSGFRPHTGGIFATGDSGATWTSVVDVDDSGTNIYRTLDVDPSDSSIVYVGTTSSGMMRLDMHWAEYSTGTVDGSENPYY